MPYHFSSSIEAKSWLRRYCVDHDLSWRDLVELMDKSVCYNGNIGKWVPFANKLYWEELASGTRKSQERQPTLKPKLGPILALLQRMTSEDELRDYLATMLFDEIVEIATAVKQKRSSRGKQVQGKARQVQAHKSASGRKESAGPDGQQASSEA